MSTRGVYGFRKNGEDKLTYNHSDSYPTGLGSTIVSFCKSTSIKDFNAIYDSIVMVNRDSKPTKEQKQTCRKYFNENVSNKSEDDWYCLLKNAQGKPATYKDGLNYMIDESNFIKESLFCEYGYIINLDNNTLEFWVGFQHEPQSENRYGEEITDGYYPCKLVKSFDLNSIPEDAVDIMEKVSSYEDEKINEAIPTF